MSAKPKTPRREAGTLNALAKGLSLSKRQVSAQLALGMPSDLTGARKWRRDRADLAPDYAAARARKMTADAQRSEIALAKERGLLVEKEIVTDQHRRIAFAIQAHLRRLENELPQICLGLSLDRSKPLVKKFIRETQLQVAQNHPDFWPDKLPDGWEL